MSKSHDNVSSNSSTTSYGQLIPRADITVPLTLVEKRRRSTNGSASARSSAGTGSVASGSKRTLEDVRQETADCMAVRAISTAETVDGNTVGVIITLSHSADERFLRMIASSLRRAMFGRGFVFAVACPSATPEDRSALVLCASTDQFVQRAGLVISSKFLGRISRASLAEPGLWISAVQNLGATSYDEAALWDCVRKVARNPIDMVSPPPGSRSVLQVLSDARARLERLTPQKAYEELHDLGLPWPVVLVDIRPEKQRALEGGIHGATIVDRGLLEWRFDPRWPHRLAIANRYDLRIIIFDQESDSSSFAAASLHDLGMLHATDIIGGFVAWREAGLPMEVTPPPPPPIPSPEPSEEY